MSDWYSFVENDDTLEQGDVIENCKIIFPNEDNYAALLLEEETAGKIPYIETDCIIMSQSCDLFNEKIKFVILCPISPLKDVMKLGGYLNSSNGIEQLRQGNQPAYHLLDKMVIRNNEDYYCVSFHNIFSVPKDYLKKIISNKKRIRLVSPYKEHLSQSFARYFMRVGLPSNIDGKLLKEYIKNKEQNNSNI